METKVKQLEANEVKKDREKAFEEGIIAWTQFYRVRMP